jgi:hypothetical protein
MKRFWAALAAASVGVLVGAGCDDYGNTFQANTGASLQFVSPSSATAGGPTFTLTLSGSGFVVQTIATWDQHNLKTCVVTTTAANVCAPANDTGSVVSVTATVPASMITKAGTHFVQTINPHSGAGTNGLSNPVAFVVYPPPNPVPAVTSISPSSVAAGSAGMTLTVTGTNFIVPATGITGSSVNWNTTVQTSLTVTNVTTTQIQVTVPASLLATAGTANVTVYNPPAPPPPNCTPPVDCSGSGGGTSNAETFTVSDPSGNNANASAALVQEETPAVSADGRYVAYTVMQGGHSQILARDTCQGADASCQTRTLVVSAALDGTAGSDDSHSPSMSSDGRYVAFSSAAENLVAEAGTGRQVYLRDTCFGASASCTPSTQLISTDPKGSLVGLEGILPSVSASGRFVSFLAVTPSASPSSAATKAGSSAAPASSGYSQVFVRDTCLGATNCTPSTTAISMQPADTSGTTAKPAGPAISGSANKVAFASGNTATLFTHSVPVDDGVFLALTKSQ